MMPPIINIGMNTAINERLIEITVKATSCTPSSAALKGATPFSICRDTFSSTTMASSTTNPVATVNAINDRLLRLKPHRYITLKVPISDTGTAMAGISVARQLRKKINTTKITSAIEISSVRSISLSEARMVVVRSITTFMSMAPGSAAASCGINARTRSAVSMMLAPGCR